MTVAEIDSTRLAHSKVAEIVVTGSKPEEQLIDLIGCGGRI
jgi:hypothetical protein